jgi:hypothetical protein
MINFDHLSASYPVVAKALASNFDAHELKIAIACVVIRHNGAPLLTVLPVGALTLKQTTDLNARLYVATRGIMEASVVLPSADLY